MAAAEAQAEPLAFTCVHMHTSRPAFPAFSSDELVVHFTSRLQQTLAGSVWETAKLWLIPV